MAGLPYNLRVNVNVPFPALVTGAAGIKVTKTNGIWTIKTDFSALAQQTPQASQYPFTLVEIWNSATGVYSTISLTNLAVAIIGISPTFVQIAGDYVVQPADTLIFINKTVPAANNVRLPPAAGRTGPVAVKDFAGNAGANNIAILPNGSETIEGQPNYLISTNFGYSPKLYPVNGGWVTAP